MYLKLPEGFLATRDAEHSARLPALSPKELFQPCSRIFRGHLQFKPPRCALLPAVPSLRQNQIKSKPEKFIANYFLSSSQNKSIPREAAVPQTSKCLLEA